MNKTFFESLDKRTKAYGERAGVEAVRVTVVLGVGRTYIVDEVVDVLDDMIQFDGRDVMDEHRVVSISIPYHQISQVLFDKAPPSQREPGFRVP